jgi:hypothetical protein
MPANLKNAEAAGFENCALRSDILALTLKRTVGTPVPLQRFLMQLRVGGGNEAAKQRMRLMWFAVKFRMKLRRQIKRMIRHFDDFNELPIRCEAAKGEAAFFKSFAIGIVEFEAMAMAFFHDE